MSQFGRFRGSSKAFLILMFPVYILYGLAMLLKLFKTEGESKVRK